MFPSYYLYLSRADSGWQSRLRRTSNPAHAWPGVRPRSSIAALPVRQRGYFRWARNAKNREAVQPKQTPQPYAFKSTSVRSGASALQRPLGLVVNRSVRGNWTHTHTHKFWLIYCNSAADTSKINKPNVYMETCFVPASPASRGPHPATLKPFNCVPKYIHQTAVRAGAVTFTDGEKPHSYLLPRPN